MSRERGPGREQVLAWAGLELAVVEDEDGVREVALAAARTLLTDLPGVEVTMDPPDGEAAPLGGDPHPMLAPDQRTGVVAGLVVTAADPVPAGGAVRGRRPARPGGLPAGGSRPEPAAAAAGAAGRADGVAEPDPPRAGAARPPRGVARVDARPAARPRRVQAGDDEHGHARGDELLRVVAARLVEARGRAGPWWRASAATSSSSSSAGTTHEADKLAARLVHVVERPVVLSGVEIRVGASVGVAHGYRGATAGGLLREADANMFVTKQAARRRAGKAGNRGAVQSTSGRP